MPQMAQQLHTSDHLIQLTLTVFFLGNATMQLILGPLADRYGYRPVLFGGGIVFVITTLMCGTSTHVYPLLIARFFQGSAVTSMVIAGYATIHALYDQKRAIKTLAWMNSITVLAPALGPLFGAIILLMGSWHWIFFILALWAILALIALHRYMLEISEKTTAISPKKIMHQYYDAFTTWSFMRPTLCLTLLFAAMIVWIAAGSFFGY